MRPINEVAKEKLPHYVMSATAESGVLLQVRYLAM